MVERTFLDQAIGGKLADELKTKKHDWIADSLLEPPERLSSYEFLTVNLGREYGEVSNVDVTPFVTHISVGGGLCAQAACFMSLCLASSNRILGISEITKLAAGEQPVLKIHGLTSRSIAKFFSDESIELESQLQSFSDEGLNQNEQQYISSAIKSYVRNGVPLIVMVSLSRMQGEHHLDNRLKAILKLNHFDFDDQDYSKLPIGLRGLSDEQKYERRNHKENDHHCVVIVGAKDDSVCVNDPATFPFLEATFAQLIDARAYVPEQGADGEIGAWVIDDDPGDPIEGRPVAPFQMVSVTPKDVVTPLLDFVGEIADEGLLRWAIEFQEAEARKLKAKLPVKNFGDFFLCQKHSGDNGEEVNFTSKREGFPDVDFALLNKIPDSWYWVQLLDHPHSTGGERRTLWFWSASAKEHEIEDSLALVLIENNPGDEKAWIVRTESDK